MYTVVLKKSQMGLELVFCLRSNTKNNLKLFDISCTNIWSNFASIFSMILSKYEKYNL